MAGIYIHIPFCKTRCIYCDFFSSVSMHDKRSYLDALSREIELRADYLSGKTIKTIYWGGGTPSQLNPDDFEEIFERISSSFTAYQPEEITIEVNPDDINSNYIRSLKKLPINRISMGIQGFRDEELQFLNRRHNAQSAINAVKICQDNGFDNISIDLIYGLPGQTFESWTSNLKQAIDLNVTHISAYHLIYEPGTKLDRLLKSGKIMTIDEELSIRMFSGMIDLLADAGFEHYEISNFAKKGFISKHNSSYWDGTHYLGIGASAHSYNGTNRQWNVSSIRKYIDSINKGKPLAEIEIIDDQTAYNDFIITRMRTSKGIDRNDLINLFGEKKETYCFRQAQKHIDNGNIELSDHYMRLTRKGIFISDSIMSDLISV